MKLQNTCVQEAMYSVRMWPNNYHQMAMELPLGPHRWLWSTIH